MIVLKKGLLLILVLGILAFIADKVTNYFASPSSGQNSTQGNSYYLTGSTYLDNFVYGGAMQLAINDFNKSYIKGQLKLGLQPTDLETKKLLDIFNKGEFSTKDLDEQSYLVTSGYGPETINKINGLMKKRFPQSNFEALNLTLEKKDFLIYAYFLKQVTYVTPFTSGKMDFKNESVAGFHASDEDEQDNIRILDYKNDDRFLLSIRLKNSEDQLFLAKGYDMKSPEESLSKINGNLFTKKMEEDDEFEAPELHFSMKRKYNDFIDKLILNPPFEKDSYKVKYMEEEIKFDMDEKGARVENRAMFGGGAGAALSEPKPHKHLFLNKPYWVIMKRTNSKNPYFILGINNSFFMKDKEPTRETPSYEPDEEKPSITI